jgi:adenosylcobinamide kinase/adenosylcobinamide-phosphate guanylyltransferase
MITFVIGGSGSGKSAYAESLLEKFQGKNKYYLATMALCDEESRKRVARHRKLREGKGFTTIEQPRDIAGALEKINAEDTDREPIGVLVECMSNLVANEMFSPDRDGTDPAEKILQGMRQLAEQVDELVIVSNNVFEDGVNYEPSAMEYLRVLAGINAALAEQADRVVEVVVGIPVVISCREIPECENNNDGENIK